MGEKIKGIDGESLELLDQTDKTYKDAAAELDHAYNVVLGQFPFLQESDLLIGIAFELLHWMYAPAGTHSTPTEMFERSFRDVITHSLFVSRQTDDGKVND